MTHKPTTIPHPLMARCQAVRQRLERLTMTFVVLAANLDDLGDHAQKKAALDLVVQLGKRLSVCGLMEVGLNASTALKAVDLEAILADAEQLAGQAEQLVAEHIPQAKAA